MQAQGVVIRQCRRRDWRTVRVLLQRHFPDELPFSRLDAELWDLYGNIVVAEVEGQVVGAAWVRHGLASGICWLDFIAVDSAHRQHGIGKKLLLAVERLALAAGERSIGLSVLRGNALAVQLYQQTGFGIVNSNDRAHELRRDIVEAPNAPVGSAPPARRSMLTRCRDLALYRVMLLRG